MIPRLILLLLATLTAAQPAGAHSHYAAGIVDANSNGEPDPGEALRFVPAGLATDGGALTTDGDGTGKIYHLCPRPFGYRPTQRCGGYYMLDENARTLFPSDSFSMIALSDGTYTGVADPLHPHGGAYLWMEIVSVTGPTGGEFGYWEENYSASSDTPTISFPVNQPTGSIYPLAPTDVAAGSGPEFPLRYFRLSEGYDFPGEDPSGHVHGRAWTATKPGNYTVSMRIVDLSTNRPGGGRWHAPSQLYTYQFQAGPNFKPTITWGTGNKITMTWPSLMGINNATSQPGIAFQIERATSLSPANWTVVATIPGTTAATVSYTDNSPPAGKSYYRRKYTWSVVP